MKSAPDLNDQTRLGELVSHTIVAKKKKKKKKKN